MLEKEFLYIEGQVNLFLGTFLTNMSIPECTKEKIENMDTSSLIKIFTSKFKDIKKNIGWLDNEMLDRAFLIRISRNKYCHATIAQNITIYDEISDLLNIKLFIGALRIVFNNNIEFQEFENYLKDTYNNLNEKKTNDLNNDNKLDNILKQLSILSDSINNIKMTIKNNNEEDEILKEEVDKIIKNEEIIKQNKKKYKIKLKQLDKNEYMQKFSSEDLDTMIENDDSTNIGNEIINKEMPYIVNIDDYTNIGSETKNKEMPYIVNINKTDIDDFKSKLQKIREKLSQNSNLIIPKSFENNNLSEWFYSISSSKWKSLAGFAKCNNLLDGYARNMLYKMGVYIDKGWKPSIPQFIYAKKLYDEIIEEYNENK